MRQLISIATCTLAIVAIVACGGRGGSDRSDVPNPAITREHPELSPQPQLTIPRPELSPQRPDVTVARPAVTAQPQVPLDLHTPSVNLTRPPVTIANVTRIANYDAAQMIVTFASQYLGTTANVKNAVGARGGVNVPSTQKAKMDVALALTGQVASAGISIQGANGTGEVGAGVGTVSGDLNADLSNASIGGYSLLVNGGAPSNADAALALVRQYYPALTKINLQPQSAQAGFVFFAQTSHTGIDATTKKAIVVAQAVLAGTSREGPATVVWVMIGNGTFSKNISP